MHDKYHTEYDRRTKEIVAICTCDWRSNPVPSAGMAGVLWDQHKEQQLKEHIITDDFGRRTVFVGELLVSETTDTLHHTKPQWVDVDVWRTQAGKFVVRRTTRYRIRHFDENCEKADGYDLSASTDADTYACKTCNPGGIPGGWAQDPRTTVDVYDTPQTLILGFATDGRYNTLARSILASVADHDSQVDAVWNTVLVP